MTDLPRCKTCKHFKQSKNPDWDKHWCNHPALCIQGDELLDLPLNLPNDEFGCVLHEAQNEP